MNGFRIRKRRNEYLSNLRTLGGDIIILLILLACAGTGFWMIAEGKSIGWVPALLGGLGGPYWMWQMCGDIYRAHRKRLWLINRDKKLAQIAEETEPFRFESDLEFWEEMWRDSNKPWALFENGTCVVCVVPEESKTQSHKNTASLEWVKFTNEEVANNALETIKLYDTELKQTGDHQIVFVQEMGAWIVSYPHKRVYNYIPFEEIGSDTAAGMIARSIRDRDAKEKKLIYISNTPPPQDLTPDRLTPN